MLPACNGRRKSTSAWSSLCTRVVILCMDKSVYNAEESGMWTTSANRVGPEPLRMNTMQTAVLYMSVL
jgi:hypothetical protein